MSLVKQDGISITLTILAVAVFLYSATFTDELMLRSTFVVVMALAGLVLSSTIKHTQVDESLSNIEVRQIIIWGAIAFVAVLFLNIFTKQAPIFAVAEEPLIRRNFAVLIAVAEEQFFRGFITPFIASRTNSILLGSVLSGVIFGIYHFAIYQSFDVLLIVFGSGIILSYVALRTGRLSPTILAHVVNNWFSVP